METLHHRPHFDRIGAILLAAVTVAGMLSLDKQSLRRGNEVIVSNIRPMLSHIMEKENETARMPVVFDEGLRHPTTSGS